MGKLAITGGEATRKTPFTPWPMGTKAEADALQSVLATPNWGGQPCPGKYATSFAKKFAETHTAKYAQCVNTGTVAIQAALKAIGIQPGDEVIAPAYTWEGTVGPVLLLNAIPVFVDIDPDTYCLDAKLIEKAITPKTKAILPVHLGMRFADMDNDGWKDLVAAQGHVIDNIQLTQPAVACKEPMLLLRNVGGRFVDASQIGR